jgi:hypothetical protein
LFFFSFRSSGLNQFEAKIFECRKYSSFFNAEFLFVGQVSRMALKHRDRQVFARFCMQEMNRGRGKSGVAT